MTRLSHHFFERSSFSRPLNDRSFFVPLCQHLKPLESRISFRWPVGPEKRSCVPSSCLLCSCLSFFLSLLMTWWSLQKRPYPWSFSVAFPRSYGVLLCYLFFSLCLHLPSIIWCPNVPSTSASGCYSEMALGLRLQNCYLGVLFIFFFSFFCGI